MIIATIVCILFAHFFVTYPLYQLCRNYISARRFDLRIIVSPVTPYTLQWQLAASLFRPYLQRFIWFRAIDWTCCWQDNDKLHQELGLCFIVVTPGHNVLCTSDPKTIEHVLKQWRDFVKPDNVNGESSHEYERVEDSLWPQRSWAHLGRMWTRYVLYILVLHV
jgi:hypothetical protein